jgi:hypothetical protein
MDDDPEWFAPKRYGYGAGLPISWQGWALTIGFALITLALARTLGLESGRFVAAMISLAVIFVAISARTTRGGWRWRWGEED